MKIIIGLGNPGKEYEKTRHNTGFMFLDSIAKSKDIKFQIDLSKKCYITNYIDNNEKIFLVKPITYMNLSGECVKNIINFYKVEVDDILVVQDDLDLPTGKIRFRKGGSSGGHNGIKSIIQNIGTQDFKRLKVGIDKNGDTIDYVLGKFSKEEIGLLNSVFDKASYIIDDYVNNSFESVMSKYN